MTDPQVIERAKARASVLLATTVIVDEKIKSVDDVVKELERLLVDTLTAERLVFLVPLAFGRVALKARGVEKFPWTARIDTECGEVLDLNLQADAIFLEALRYAVESYEGDGVAEQSMNRIAANSPEVDAALRAETAGENIRQARLHEGVWRSRLHATTWLMLGQVTAVPLA